jgi:hypothetical protein
MKKIFIISMLGPENVYKVLYNELDKVCNEIDLDTEDVLEKINTATDIKQINDILESHSIHNLKVYK